MDDYIGLFHWLAGIVVLIATFFLGWTCRGELDAQSLAAAVERGEARLTKQEADQ